MRFAHISLWFQAKFIIFLKHTLIRKQGKVGVLTKKERSMISMLQTEVEKRKN